MSAKLGRRIRALRRLKLVTQQELARSMSISVTMLSNIERGQKTPSPELLENIAVYLNISGEELFVLSVDHDSINRDEGCRSRISV